MRRSPKQVALHDSLRREDPTGLHFKEIVRRQLIERFGKDAVYKERLRVYTTIDPDMQKAAEAAVVSSLSDIESRMPRRRHRAAYAGRAATATASRCRHRCLRSIRRPAKCARSSAAATRRASA